ncbi:MAG: AzlC family ABC transporter permease [Tepidimonas sp.]|uniref:AzlC family ABC transporter permease n=1 Tax=Tepidimonas sp. TaxID=2002775 RepID=UPI00298ED952|nr:AzlC family ABC transporter permease [Tepidimonas sp.]MCS6810533.1 AzlC family ABC transporter permease [Tepidimonas sp.]MDW8335539.1 AzlC family ABC transporter permease [Tepidimonas sp.]
MAFWRTSFLSAELRTHPAFALGARELAGAATGIAAWGLMTGVAMVQGGLSPLEATLMTLLVYAGSAQLTAVPLMVAGAPLWVVLAAAFCVNLRFVVFSAHLRPYLAHLPRGQRLLTGYLTGDLSYVFFAKRYPRPGATAEQRREQEAYLAGSCGLNYLAWNLASLVGIGLAHAIPTAWGLGFAGILALLGVACSLATSWLRVLSATVAGSAAVVAWALPLKLNILVAIAAAVLVCLVAEAQAPHWRRVLKGPWSGGRR